MLSDKAFDDRLFTEFVIINAKKTNEASIAVAKKLGFALEPQQFNNQSDMVTYSKSDRSEFRNFVRGKKLISDTRNP